MKQLLEEARMLGCVVVTNTSDAGQHVSLGHGEGATLSKWAAFIDWGDEARHERRLRLWLNTLPWPTEDDPRVEHTGAYA